MKFETVLPALRKGRAIARSMWDKGLYYQLTPALFCDVDILDGRNVSMFLDGQLIKQYVALFVGEEILAEDWVILDEQQ